MPLPKLYQLFCWHYSINGDNPDKKNMGLLFFDEECIYEILKPYLKLVTDGRTEAQSNMPLNFFKVGGIKTAQMVLSAELKGIQSSRYEMSLNDIS